MACAIHVFNKYGECKNEDCAAKAVPNHDEDRFFIQVQGFVHRRHEPEDKMTPVKLQLEYEIRDVNTKDHYQHTNRYEVPVLINIMEIENEE